MSTPPLLIPGPVGPLEILITSPSSPSTDDRRPTAILCHPHPLYGGSLHNKVVHTLATAIAHHQATVIRFNFRGVGHSLGHFDHGIGEVQDLLAVMQWAITEQHPTELWLGGFSFGSYIALKTHHTPLPPNLLQNSSPKLTRLILIAPPVDRFNFQTLQLPNLPTLIIQGLADDVVSPNAVIDWLAQQPHPAQFYPLPGVGHFFHGHLIQLRELIHTFLNTPKPKK